jgi:hypothetical protein
MNNDPVSLDDYQDMQERAERAERSAVEWRDVAELARHAADALSHRCYELAAEVERLREAMEIYADKANWERDYYATGDLLFHDDIPGCQNGYDIARRALRLDTTEA